MSNLNCCVPVVIPFTNVPSLVINYTAAMREAFGVIPTVFVYHLDPTFYNPDEYIKANVEVKFDGSPATQIKIDNGGNATGYVKIQK